jgi:L-threonylcarbamoyladenylate synthase
MHTKYLNQSDLTLAGQMLAQGQLVAFPTETVYGLGANALNAQAIGRIFEAKGRPSDNPLIVHIASRTMLSSLVLEADATTQHLMDAFWPGPLTIVFPKQAQVPDCVTAGLPTVAIRMPSHPWTSTILESAGVPVAAPSANRSGSPSATTWQAVQQDLDGRIDAIVCGPSCDVGLESTVLDTSGPHPRILRPGTITFEQLKRVCPLLIPYQGHEARSDQSWNSPGLRHKHYQPSAKVTLWIPTESLPHWDQCQSNTRWYLGLSSPAETSLFARVELRESIESYAQVVYQYFREADAAGIQEIVCEVVPDTGLGQALMDRLRRASS